MKREDVTKVFEGATDEQINAILNINSADIGKAKGDYDTLKSSLEAANGTISTLKSEVQTLKDSNADAEDWKKKFEELDKKVKDDEAAAAAEKAKAEKEADILNRYNAVCVDKDGKPLEFTHEAIRAEYLKKFGEIISDIDNTEYKGKSDADIFYALTKDDGAAFKGVKPEVNLKGGSPLGGVDDAQIRAVMGLK